MIKVSVRLDNGAHMPERAHDTDAGADLRCIEGLTIEPRSSAVVDTGVHVQIPHGMCGLLVAKSGLNVKHGIHATGLIDEGYTGSVVVKLYNDSDEPYVFEAGDKVTQLVLLPVCYPIFEKCDEILGGDRGDCGYGSTGR